MLIIISRITTYKLIRNYINKANKKNPAKNKSHISESYIYTASLFQQILNAVYKTIDSLILGQLSSDVSYQ